jgi:hypothetical protein
MMQHWKIEKIIAGSKRKKEHNMTKCKKQNLIHMISKKDSINKKSKFQSKFQNVGI